MKDELLALAEKIRSRIVADANGCWLWPGAKNSRGYGQVWCIRRKRVFFTHRVMHEAANGAIPDGLQIDHLCRVRACCNPEHLEAVTPRVNVSRGLAAECRRREGAQVTHCPHGHAYTPENTYVCRQGKRSCRACQRARHEAARAARPLTEKSIQLRRYYAQKRGQANA